MVWGEFAIYDVYRLVYKLKYQLLLYAAIEPFFTLNITKKTKKNIYIGVKKKLTSQHPLTKRDIKSSRITWNNKNSLPKNPAL